MKRVGITERGREVAMGKVPVIRHHQEPSFYNNFLKIGKYLFSGYFLMSTAVADEREASAISVFMFLKH